VQCDALGNIPGSAGCQPAVVGSFPTTDFFKTKVVRMCVEAFRQAAGRTGWQPVLLGKKFALGAPETHGANQSLPLKPAESKDPEQAGRDRRGLGNDRASQLEVVELGVLKVASSRSSGEEESKREVWSVVSRGRDGETHELVSTVGWKCGSAKSGKRTPSINAELNRHEVETIGAALDREAQGHVLKQTLRRGNTKVEMAVVIIGHVGERHIQIWS
jgi:hypothetical protein